jgi:hypothetical protein
MTAGQVSELAPGVTCKVVSYKINLIISGLTRKVLLNNCAKHASVDFPASKGIFRQI